MHLLPLIRRCRHALVGAAVLGMSCAAHAQIDKVNKNITYVRDGILGVCAVLITVLLIWAGIEIAAKHKRPIDVWPIVLGASLVGIAGTAAAFFVS